MRRFADADQVLKVTLRRGQVKVPLLGDVSDVRFLYFRPVTKYEGIVFLPGNS